MKKALGYSSLVSSLLDTNTTKIDKQEAAEIQLAGKLLGDKFQQFRHAQTMNLGGRGIARPGKMD